MSINSKKLVSAALTATTMLWMVGAAALPLANAQTTSSLQTQIAALLAQIQTLQGQLNAGSTTTTSGMTYDFTSDLTIGSTGTQVSQLQQLLISDGYLTAVSAPTGYFGALTQAALGKFQAANGISPTAGYFGPKTRAFVNAMSSTTTTTTTTSGSLPAGCTTTSGYSSTTGVSCSTGMTSVVAPSTGLAVSVASNNPAGGSLISGAGRTPVMAFNLTAGNSGAVTVSSLSFQQVGVLSESAVSGAYLIQNGQVVAQYSSLNNDLLTFSGLALSIPAGQTETYQLAVNITGVQAGNTTSFIIPSASDVVSFDSSNNAVSASGSFPVNGNVFTVTTVSNPSLATMTISNSSIGNSVTAGTQGNIVGSWTFQVSNNPVWLQNVNFHVIGSANDANLQNVKLLVNGTQVGATLSSVPANGMADFNTSSTGVELSTGSNNVQVVADVMGSPSDEFTFEILNNYDVLAVDSQYNVPINVSLSGANGTQVNIQQGQITLTQDANTPTGNIANGVSGVTLAKFDLYAAGEPVKVQWLDFNIDLNGVSSGATLAQQLQNVQITDDAGNQVGTTINNPPSSNTCTPAAGAVASSYGTSATNITTATAIYADCFGSSNSPINYIVPANTTRVLSLKADIPNAASFNNIQANLVSDTNNLQGMISSQSGSTSGVSGVALSRVSSSLGVSVNNALGSQVVSAGTTNLRIGSFALSASSAGGVNVNTVTMQLTPNATSGVPNEFQNLKLLVNGVQFGTTVGVTSSTGTYVFSGSPFNVPAGTTVNVDVYADTLSNATGTVNPATELTGLTGVGQTSYSSVSLVGGPYAGQQVSFNGQPALTIAADSSNPPAGQIVQNSTGNTLAVFRFSETSNVENVKVTQLNVVDAVASSGVKAAFSNVSLWNGSTLLGTAASPILDVSGMGYIYVFNSFTNPLVVPQGSSVSLTLKGNAGSYTNGSLTDNTTSTFEIATTTDSTNNTSSLAVIARGATSNKTAVTTLSGATGNPQTTLRSSEAVAGTPVSSLPPASFQQIGSVTLTSNSAGDTIPNSLVLTFNGTAATGTFMSGLVLKDQNGTQITPSSNTTTTVTWNSGKLNPYVVTAGSSYTFQVWGDLSQIGSVPNASQSLTAQIKNPGDYTYLDASTNGISVSLPTIAVPITVVSLTSPNGGQF
jgi:hypothetical protein